MKLSDSLYRSAILELIWTNDPLRDFICAELNTEGFPYIQQLDSLLLEERNLETPDLKTLECLHHRYCELEETLEQKLMDWVIQHPETFKDAAGRMEDGFFYDEMSETGLLVLSELLKNPSSDFQAAVIDAAGLGDSLKALYLQAYTCIETRTKNKERKTVNYGRTTCCEYYKEQ